MLNVLIVEDSHEVGRLVKEAVLSLGSRIEAVVVPSAEEALLEAARQPADLLVVDIRLPGISGLELVKKMRARQPGLKVIVITALSDEKLPALATELGVEGFFRKPVEMAPFLQRAAECLGLEFKPSGEPVAAGSLPEVLAGLRHALGARGVFLLDGSGGVQAQDGTLPRAYGSAELFPPLVSAQPAPPAMRERLGAGGSVALHWGGSLALAVTAVDDTRWLAAALPGGEAALLSPALLPGMLQAAQALAQLPRETETGTPAVEPAQPQQTPPAPGVTLEKLEALSDLLSGQAGSPDAADAFWEQAADDPASAPKGAASGAPAIGQVLPEE